MIETGVKKIITEELIEKKLLHKSSLNTDLIIQIGKRKSFELSMLEKKIVINFNFFFFRTNHFLPWPVTWYILNLRSRFQVCSLKCAAYPPPAWLVSAPWSQHDFWLLIQSGCSIEEVTTPSQLQVIASLKSGFSCALELPGEFCDDRAIQFQKIGTVWTQSFFIQLFSSFFLPFDFRIFEFIFLTWKDLAEGVLFSSRWDTRCIFFSNK